MDLNITTQGWIQKAELDLHKAFEKELQDKFKIEFDKVMSKLLEEMELDKPLTKVEAHKLRKIEIDLNNDLNKLIE